MTKAAARHHKRFNRRVAMRPLDCGHLVANASHVLRGRVITYHCGMCGQDTVRVLPEAEGR